MKVVSEVLLPDISSNSGKKAVCELSATSGLEHTAANGFAFGQNRNTQFSDGAALLRGAGGV